MPHAVGLGAPPCSPAVPIVVGIAWCQWLAVLSRGAGGGLVLSREFCTCSRQVCGGETTPVLLGRVRLWPGRGQRAGQRPRVILEAGSGPGLSVTAKQLKAPEELGRTLVPGDGHGQALKTLEQEKEMVLGRSCCSGGCWGG